MSRRLSAGDIWVQERWTAGLELPALVWEVECDGTPGVEFAWSVDLRRMWPYPEACYGDLRWNVSDDLHRLWCGAEGAPGAGLLLPERRGIR